MRHFTIVLLGGLLSGAAVLGQTPQTAVFRGGVTLVTVDVTVLDRDGKPVPGLTADDFEIKLDGHVQPVRTAAYEQVAIEPVRAAAAPPAPQAVPARETTNATPVPELRLFVVMLDDLSITPSRGKDMFFAAGRFVDALPLSDVVGFTTTSGTATLNPTRNRQAVDAVLRHTAGEFIDSRMSGPPVGIQEALEVWAGDATMLKQIIQRDCFQGAQAPSQSAIANSSCAEQVERKVRMLGSSSRMTAARQLQAYVNVINAMKAAPGLKQLVIVSDGLGVASREQQMDFQPVARAAAEAGVHLSVLEQEPDLTSVEDRSSVDNQVRRADNLMLTEGLITMTEETGGDFYRVIGLPDSAFQRVTIATSGVYHLGVEAPAGSAPGRNFSLAARVKRSAVTVHANRVAVLAAPATPVTVDEQLQAAVSRGSLPNYGVPVSVATVIRRGDASTQLDLDANLEVPASTPGPLMMMFGLLDAGGTLRTGRKTIEAPASGGNYLLSFSLPVSPGAYRLRFGIADASGHVGSIDALVTAELDRVGPFLTSDVMTSWSGADGKLQFAALEEVPPTATGLHTLLELYPASDAPLPADVRVQWSVIGSGLQPAAEQFVVPTHSTDRLTATGEFPLDNLAPGTYELRATVSA